VVDRRIAEVALFAASARVIAAVGTARLLMLAGLAAALRWGVMALDPPLLLLGPLQTLHAISFGAAHVAAIHFLTHAVPRSAPRPRKASTPLPSPGSRSAVRRLPRGRFMRTSAVPPWRCSRWRERRAPIA
jgi:PPP family 3-phenylpropionic acid transporter